MSTMSGAAPLGPPKKVPPPGRPVWERTKETLDQWYVFRFGRVRQRPPKSEISHTALWVRYWDYKYVLIIGRTMWQWFHHVEVKPNASWWW